MREFLCSVKDTESCYGTNGDSFEFNHLNISCESVANVYNTTKHNNAISDVMSRVVKSDDSDAVGEYHTLDTKKWIEIDNRVYNEEQLQVERLHGNKEVVVFIQIGKEGITDKCKNYILFYKKDWIEYRKERGDNKNKRTKSTKFGRIWVGKTTGIHKFRVFVLRENK